MSRLNKKSKKLIIIFTAVIVLALLSVAGHYIGINKAKAELKEALKKHSWVVGSSKGVSDGVDTLEFTEDEYISSCGIYLEKSKYEVIDRNSFIVINDDGSVLEYEVEKVNDYMLCFKSCNTQFEATYLYEAYTE